MGWLSDTLDSSMATLGISDVLESEIIGDITGTNAIDDATDAQIEAIEQSNELLWQMFEETMAMQEPWMVAGEWSLSELLGDPIYDEAGELTGYSGTGVLSDPSLYTESPGYEWLLGETINALDQSAAARGRLLSGAHQEDVMAYASGLASQDYQNYLNNLFNVAGLGQVGTTSGAQTTEDYTSALSENILSAGDVRASGYMAEGQAIAELLQTGLDHVLLMWHDEIQEKFLIALENSLCGDVYTAVHITITPDNQNNVHDVIKQLADMGVHGVSLSATSSQCFEPLKQSRDYLADTDTTLIWNLPVPYSKNNPVNLEVHNQEYLQGAARNWLYIEPDGDVLPSQGIFSSFGNFKTDSWEEINQARILYLDNLSHEQDQLG